MNDKENKVVFINRRLIQNKSLSIRYNQICYQWLFGKINNAMLFLPTSACAGFYPFFSSNRKTFLPGCSADKESLHPETKAAGKSRTNRPGLSVRDPNPKIERTLKAVHAFREKPGLIFICFSYTSRLRLHILSHERFFTTRSSGLPLLPLIFGH